MQKKKEVKKEIARRINIIEGHWQKIKSMVADERYCIDVLQQTAAVKSAISKVEELMLNEHLHSCVVKELKTNRDTKAINEIMQVFKKINR